MNLLHVEIAPYTPETIAALDAGTDSDERQFLKSTVLVPNVVLNGTLIEVEWRKKREDTHPKATSASSAEEAYRRRRANAAASQTAALSTGRYAAGYANAAAPAQSAYPTSLLEKAQQVMAQRQHSAAPQTSSQWFDGLDMSEKDR